MGTSILFQVLERPATSVVSTLLAAVYFYITSHTIGYAEVGLNYEQAVQKLELWRIVTAQLSHVELLHLLFNVSTLWSLGVVEESGSGARSGTLYYFQTSLVLLIFSGLVCLLFYHVLGVVLRREQFLSVTTVGYSAVIFGWMTILSRSGVASFSVFGLANIPMWLTPFASLVLTSIIIPRASFLGHLSGIVVGYMVASGIFDWLTLWWLLSLTAWTAALLVFHLVRSGRLEVPWLRMVPSDGAGDIETGVPVVRIVDGVLERR
ncbi:g1477 [Coccomyxa elongata]